MKELLFSITKKNFDIVHFKASGKGGQKRNKTSSAVRITHRESGAVWEGKEHRHQHINKKNAFHRCIESDKFKKWFKIEVARKTGEWKQAEKRIKKQVDEWMKPENIKGEYL